MSAENIELSPAAKAWEINKTGKFYGTICEIGAGQETATYFFRAGRASNTIAKTMSAYGKETSADIYGEELRSQLAGVASDKVAFVSRTRLLQMLHREWELLIRRSPNSDHEKSRFFVFANTVSTQERSKTERDENDKVITRRSDPTRAGYGWLGVRFQVGDDPNNRRTASAYLHVRLRDEQSSDQREAVGIVGVNLLHGALTYLNGGADDATKLIERLLDSVGRHRAVFDHGYQQSGWFCGGAKRDPDNVGSGNDQFWRYAFYPPEAEV